MRVFERAGAQNTEETLRIALDAARARALPLVVATTRGATAEEALRQAAGAGVKLIVVTHNCGFAEPGHLELDAAVRRRVEEGGHRVLIGTLPLRSLGTALRKLMGGSEQEIVNAALRIFCQGAKVCVEMAAINIRILAHLG